MARIEDARIAAVAAALPADAPDAAEFRYDPAWESLEGEVRKGDKGGPGAVDWASVARQAVAVLTEKSKDLMAASWFVVAAGQTEGLAGLAIGLSAMRDLVEQHWPTLFPPVGRERARVQAVEWLAARAARLVPETAAAGQGEAALAAFVELDALNALLDEKLTKESASLTDLVRALRPLADAEKRAIAERAVAQAAKEAATEVAAAAPPPAAPPVTAAAPVTVPALAIAAGGTAEQTVDAVQTAVRGAALALIEADLAEARGFALLATVTWLAVTEPPPAPGGRTPLMPPPETRRTEFEALRAASNLQGLVLSVARFVSGSGMFWLDGQRLMHQALLQLGPKHAGSARAVARGVALALDRLPGLAGLRFQDGTPFADVATQAWIEQEAQVGAAADAPAGEAAPWVEGLAEARRLTGEGKEEEALALLAAGADAAGSGRARCRWRLALGRLCLDAGHAAVALPVLRAALAEAEAALAWEPDVAAAAALLLHQCLSTAPAALGLDEAARTAEAARAMGVLARLDPVNAVRASRTRS